MPRCSFKKVGPMQGLLYFSVLVLYDTIVATLAEGRGKEKNYLNLSLSFNVRNQRKRRLKIPNSQNPTLSYRISLNNVLPYIMSSLE